MATTLKKTSTAAIAMAVFVAVVCIGTVVAGWTFSSGLMYPSYECTEEHFLYCGDPSQLQLDFENVAFSSDDGIDLSGWYIPAPDSSKVIIFVHGHGADRHEGMRWFTSVHTAGFNILAFDLRNSGQSGGDFSSMSYFERQDVIAAVDFLQNEKNLESIGVFGTSMGAVTSMMAMDQDPRISAGVFEAGWANLEDLLSEVFSKHVGLPRVPFLSLTTWLFQLRSGVDMTAVNPETVVANIAPRPVFIIHCEGDELINISHGERNFSAAQQPKDYWRSPCDVHARAWQSAPKYIEVRVTEYFLQYL
jgi:dipeptidyl aminopeptidase/acylaminoacyl peptidase